MAKTRLSEAQKALPCRYCGKPMMVNGYQRKRPHHLDCAIEELQENISELAQKSGPRYDRWREAMRKKFAE